MGRLDWLNLTYWKQGFTLGILLIVGSYILVPGVVMWGIDWLSLLLSYRAVQLVVSASLLAVTGVYAYETRKQTDEMERDREAKFRPIISPTVETLGISSFNFAIENSGKGAAYDVDAEWWMEGEKDDSITWKIPLLSSGERRRFRLPTERKFSSSTVEDKYGNNDILHFQASFKDGLGNSFEPGDGGADLTIKLTDTMASREDASEYLEQDELHKIRKELEDIRKTIDKNPPLGSKVVEVRDKNNSIITSLLDNLGPLSLSDLKRFSGLPWDEVTQTVHRLDNLGVVDYDSDTNIRSSEARSDIEIRYTGNDW